MTIRFLQSVDGVICASPEIYEPECIEGMRKWFGARGVYACGPLMPVGQAANAIEKNESARSAQIDQFLDGILQFRGDRTLLYVREFITPIDVVQLNLLADILWNRFLAISARQVVDVP